MRVSISPQFITSMHCQPFVLFCHYIEDKQLSIVLGCISPNCKWGSNKPFSWIFIFSWIFKELYYRYWAFVWMALMAAHSSTLAQTSPWTEEPGGLQSMGSQRVGHDLVTSQLHDTKFGTNLYFKKIHSSGCLGSQLWRAGFSPSQDILLPCTDSTVARGLVALWHVGSQFPRDGTFVPSIAR